MAQSYFALGEGEPMRLLETSLAATLLLTLAACGSGDEQARAPAGEAESAGAPAETPVVEAAPAEVPAAEATPASARPAAFAQCMSCHAVEPGKHLIGPSLAGVFNARAGHAEGYAYSAALAGSGLTWDEPTLDTYLAGPMKKVPGTKMTYAGLSDAAARQEVIAYLKTL